MRLDSARLGLLGLTFLVTLSSTSQADDLTLRPPSVPLIVCDPYFCIWSPADHLTDSVTRHWTGSPHPLTSLIRIDQKAYRLMGVEPADHPALPQTSVTVLPTRTLYTFAGGGIELTLTFLTPALPDDLALLSRPVTYLTWSVKATDGASHEVSLWYDQSPLLAVNTPEQEVAGESSTLGDLRVLSMGTVEQPILMRRGDNVRLDWGQVLLAIPESGSSNRAFFATSDARSAFARMMSVDRAEFPDGLPAAAAPLAAVTFDLGSVGASAVERMVIVAYDDIESIQYFGQNLKPYWRRDGWRTADLLKASAAEYEAIRKRCAAFDTELMEDLDRAGGPKYAQIAALAYRQCFAGNKIAADAAGQPLIFPKENDSNGCIGTVDVIFPMAPQFLLFGPSLTKGILVQNLAYAASPQWRFPFAPHDLGTYPQANGQVYGGGERTEENQMPVEESGNMLILVAALAKMEGNADFVAPYWPTLLRWAEYLKDKGFDPENQLCTDDFAGHLAHNVNLSAKAIIGLGAFSQLCALRGDAARADEYRTLAHDFARRWIAEADDGTHFRLAFDRPGTWSQKYNLVWDRLLGPDLFPAEVLRKEMDFYRSVQNTYGLPLDNRADYTKLDWIAWTATLTGEPADFEALIDPIHAFLNATADRVPMTDWYLTTNARMRGFKARPVVGGVFLRMLGEPDIWTKWASRDTTRASGWAPLPTPPRTEMVVPTSEDEPQTYLYTTTEPASDWMTPAFDAENWSRGAGGFGTPGTPSAVVRTLWNTPSIWLRREIMLPEGLDPSTLRVRLHHDEDATLYINGVAALRASGYSSSYELRKLSPAGLKALVPGRNVLAIECRQTGGGQYIDVGLVQLVTE